MRAPPTVLALFVLLSACGEEKPPTPAPPRPSAAKEPAPAQAAPKPEETSPEPRRYEAKVEEREEGPKGVLRGRVVFQGALPQPETVSVEKDAETCAKHGPRKAVPSFVVGADGGLRDVFVEIKDAKGSRALAVPDDPVVVDQIECEFSPRLTAVPEGASVAFANSDPVLHNVKGTALRIPGFNDSVPPGGRSVRKFDRPDRIELACVIHPWMRGFVVVTANPYHAVTGADGTFEIDGLEPGPCTLSTWHEKVGRREFPIEIPSESGLRATIVVSP